MNKKLGFISLFITSVLFSTYGIFSRFLSKQLTVFQQLSFRYSIGLNRRILRGYHFKLSLYWVFFLKRKNYSQWFNGVYIYRICIYLIKQPKSSRDYQYWFDLGTYLRSRLWNG